MAVVINGSTGMTIPNGVFADSSGNVGIGTSSPSSALHLSGAATTNSKITLTQTTAGLTGYLQQGSSGVALGGLGAQSLLLETNGVTRATIDSSGNLLVGTTTASGKFVVAGAISNTFIPSDGNGITFTRNAANYIQANGGSSASIQVISNTGGVNLANGATSWAAVSDETQKDIIEPIQNAANKVSTLRAVIGKYKTDEEGKRRSFLIAQDVQAVLPEAVTTITQEDGSEILGLSYTDTIPLLVAAVKELNDKVEAQAAEIAQLKGQV